MGLDSSDPYRKGLRLAEKGLYAAAIEQFERALVRQPQDIHVLFALGNTAHAMGRPGLAEKFYLRVLDLAPLRLEAIVSLANVLREMSRFDEAETWLQKALQANPKAAELWLTLGSVFRDRGNDAQAEVFYREAFTLHPGYVPALGNLADILADRGGAREALAMYETILRLEPDNVQTRLHRATVLLSLGVMEEGWREYAVRLKMLPCKAPQGDHGLPRWDGVVRPGLRLLVTAEQGIGDQVMFASPCKELEAKLTAVGGLLILECEPRLVGPFSGSFVKSVVRPWCVETHGGKIWAQYAWLAEAGGADAFVEMGSLPSLTRRHLADFPVPNVYLRAEQSEKKRWQDTFSALPKPLIGICWRSGKLGGQRTRQYAPLESWESFLAGLPGTVVSLQYDATAEEVGALARGSGRRIFVPPGLDQKNEIGRTLAMISTLDAAVCAPTAVSWLAAAVGTPVWKVLGCPTWTNFGTDYEPFAPAAKILTVPPQKGWGGVFAAAAAALTHRFSDPSLV